MKDYEVIVPKDYKDPNWNVYQRVHGWRNYVPDWFMEHWDSFSDEYKAHLANWAEELAMKEEWD